MSFSFHTKVVTFFFLVISFLLYLIIFKYNEQEKINKELLESFKILQVQQNHITSLLVESNERFKKEIDVLEHNIIAKTLSFTSCVDRRKLGVTDEYFLEAIQQLCAPPQLNISEIFEDKNNVFLECVIEKGKNNNSENIKRIEEECTKYEIELSKQISKEIQRHNN